MFYINHISSKVGQLVAYINFIVHSAPGGSESKQSACSAGDLSSTPESESSLEKGTASHSRILAWRIPWTEEPGGLQSMGPQRVRHN